MQCAAPCIRIPSDAVQANLQYIIHSMVAGVPPALALRQNLKCNLECRCKGYQAGEGDSLRHCVQEGHQREILAGSADTFSSKDTSGFQLSPPEHPCMPAPSALAQQIRALVRYILTSPVFC
jgi:hypothetical protein